MAIHHHPSNNQIYEFIEGPISLLNESVPASVPFGDFIITPAVVDEDGNIITSAVTRRKTFGELLIHYVVSLDGTKGMYMLGIKTHLFGRIKPTSPSQRGIFSSVLAPLGYPQSKWFGVEEYWNRLSGPDYTEPEV